MTPAEAWREDEGVQGITGQLGAHGCCMEDYGQLGDLDVIERGRMEYDRLLDAYARAVARATLAAARERVEELRRHHVPPFTWNKTLDAVIATLTPEPETTDG